MICILDLDGTLIDSTERHHRLMREILQEKMPEIVTDLTAIDTAVTRVKCGKDVKMQFDAVEFMKFKADGNSGKRYLLERLGIAKDTAEQISRKWQQEIEKDRWLMMDVLYPDTIEFLENLKKRHNILYYLTARQNEEGVLQEVKRLGIAGYADGIKVVAPADALKEKKAFVEELIKQDAASSSMSVPPAAMSVPPAAVSAPPEDREQETLQKMVSGRHIHIVGDTENEYQLAVELSLSYSILNRGFRSKKYWELHGVKSLDSLRDIHL